MPNNIPSYDAFARKRIWLTLKKIRVAKKLTWEQLASQIHTHTGVTVHVRYFSRLRSGGLSNEIVHQIVLTIDRRYIHGFVSDVHILPASPLEQPEHEVSVQSNYRRWRRIQGVEKENILKNISIDGGIVFDPGNTDVKESPLGFGSNLYLYEIASFESLPPATFAWISNGAFTINVSAADLIDKMQRKFLLKLDSKNVFEFAFFYIDFIHETLITPITNISMLSDLHRRFAFSKDFGEVLSSYHNALCTPVEHGFLVVVVAIQDNKLISLSLHIGTRGDILFVAQSPICDLSRRRAIGGPAVWPGEMTLEGHKFSREVIENILSALELSPIGRILKAVCEKFFIEFNIIGGPKFVSTYHPGSRSVIVVVAHDAIELNEAQIVYVVASLRFADQEAMGFVAARFHGDMREFATRSHAKNLDALVYACKFVKEIESHIYRERYVRSLPSIIKDLYEAYVRGASREEMFDIYCKD